LNMYWKWLSGGLFLPHRLRCWADAKLGKIGYVYGYGGQPGWSDEERQYGERERPAVPSARSRGRVRPLTPLVSTQLAGCKNSP